jgi:phosphatidate cytidylyltransferase
MSTAETAARFEWPARALFGILLAGCAVAALVAGNNVFAALVCLIAAAAAREWHRMLGGARYALPIMATTLAVASALICSILLPGSLWPLWILGIGSMLAAFAATAAGDSPLWNGVGTLYIGLPALSLVALRAHTAAAIAATLVVFLAVWAADTGALLGGKMLGGPKFVPALSPNKTWAGFFAGTLLSVAVVTAYIGLFRGRLWQAAFLGLVLALASHGGDLFESWVKRRVGRKNSGGLIPGHGGVLDRIDSTLFAAPLAALLVFVFGLDPLCGGHP